MAIVQGKTCTLIDTCVTAAGSQTKEFTVEADNALFSLYVESVAGDLDVVVYTLTDEGKETDITTFPTISAPTTELLIKKSAVTMSRIRVEATYTGAACFEVRARGIGTGETSVRILGSNNARVEQYTITTTPTLLIPVSIMDRQSINLRNYTTGSEVLYLGFSLADTTTAKGYPLLPGESIGIDLQEGGALYVVADTGTIDVRLIEMGE